MADNSEELRRELVDGLDDATIHLAFAWKNEPDRWVVVRVRTEELLADELREMVRQVAADLKENRSHTAYDPAWPLTETEFFSIQNPRSGDPPMAPVGGDLFPQLDEFGGLPGYERSRRRSNPQLYVVLAQFADGSIAKFGRRVTARHLLKPNKWIRGLWDGESFRQLEDGPIFTLDPFIDWIEWSDIVLIIDAGGFHATFRTLAELTERVAANVEAIATEIGIRNKDEFIRRCQTTPSMASKLDSVVAQEFYKSKSVDDLKEYSEKYPGLKAEWDGDELIFDGDLEKQWSILKLLDEAAFTGELSGEQFEAAAKRTL